MSLEMTLKINEGAAQAAPDNENLLWLPKSTEGHELEILRSKINGKFGLKLKDYFELHSWSVKHYKDFWSFLVGSHLNLLYSGSPEVAYSNKKMDDLPPHWFPDLKINYAENLLKYENEKKIAYYYTTERMLKEGHQINKATFGELKNRVARIAYALKHKFDVKSGDRVVGYIPNCPEALEIMLASASLGAIWSSTSPDFGTVGVLDRFKQINPKVIFSIEAVSYNLKTHNHLGKLKDVVKGLSPAAVVVIPFLAKDKKEVDLSSIHGNVMFMEDFLSSVPENPDLKFERVPFSHPLFIMFSSGTTGVPKCIIHSTGGTLLKHVEEHQIQGNRKAQDVVLYYTTTGWMMWNWLVSALAIGSTLVIYDGSPLHPTHSALWDLVDECGITVFGTSAKWIAFQEEKGIKPRLTHKLKTLKTILSTGSPLKPHSYDYVYREIKTDLLLASISGGTDIIACFMGENSVLPVHKGEIQHSHLGCDIQCFNYGGKKEEKGTAGDLVCASPFPSMPVGFWNDDEKHSAYRSAYFDKYPHVWAHGDYLVINPKTNGFVMLGRSDGTLNPNGVRFGSAEIYNIVETFSEIADSLCVGQRSPMDRGGEERVLLFLKMKPQHSMSDELISRLKSSIRSGLSVRHLPSLFFQIDDIPYTINGKKVEVAVKKILAGQSVKNQSALANPESLDLFRNIPETKIW
uniref:Acetoacetyl-CoA synthetase n=1 Tax=Lepeophtheirus salmonis TaxID=72036 RepID=A0A0K2TTA6_LEPSM